MNLVKFTVIIIGMICLAIIFIAFDKGIQQMQKEKEIVPNGIQDSVLQIDTTSFCSFWVVDSVITYSDETGIHKKYYVSLWAKK